MSSGSETIQSIHLSPQIDRGSRIHLNHETKITDPLLIKIANLSPALYQAATHNSVLLSTLRTHANFISLLSQNPMFLEAAIKNPELLNKLVETPENPRELSAKQFDESVVNKTFAEGKLDELAKSKNRKRAISQNLNVADRKPVQKTVVSRQSTVKVDLKPHKLESEVMAKAHVENPNTGIPVGDFRQLNRGVVRNPSVLPHDLELQPELITNARAFSLSPELLALMSAQAIATNRTKRLSMSGNPDDDDFEIENETDKSASKEESIEEIAGISESEPIQKTLPHIKQ